MFFGVGGPLTPDPSPPFYGGEGRIRVRWSGELRAVWSHAKTRRREGKGRVWRSEQCDGLCFSPFHFLASALYGRDAMAPNPFRPFHGGEGRIGGQWHTVCGM